MWHFIVQSMGPEGFNAFSPAWLQNSCAQNIYLYINIYAENDKGVYVNSIIHLY